MAKVTKKKNRKLRKQIRKTVGALLMVSAITVAAIPVQDVRGADGEGTQTTSSSAKIQVLNYANASMSSHDALQNDTGANLSSIESYLESEVPYVDPGSPIYTTGDGRFQFAFVKPSGNDTDEVAVILGANVKQLPGGKLTIPLSVDAYKKYIANTTSSGYCAVNRSGEFLYYEDTVQKLNESRQPLYYVPELDNRGILPDGSDADGNLTTYSLNAKGDKFFYTYKYTEDEPKMDENGDPVLDENNNPVMEPVDKTKELEAVPRNVTAYMPCYYNNRAKWEDLADDQLFYWSSTDTNVNTYDTTNFSEAEDYSKQRIHDAEVQYIGRQYLEPYNQTGSEDSSDYLSEWRIPENGGKVNSQNPSKGVFAGKGQIVSLTVETKINEDGDAVGNLLGVGDYAFYGCTGLASVQFENGLNTIGNGAFEGCSNLRTCSMKLHSGINAIGARAFSGSGLTSINIPASVRAIGDYCFAECKELQTIDLCATPGFWPVEEVKEGEKVNVSLSAIGYNAFENCSSLTSVTFPENYVDFEKVTQDGKVITGIPITYFSGCTALQYIKVQNSEFTFIENEHKDDLSCEIGKFLKIVEKNGFYFEGPYTSEIHNTAKKHSAAFKYVATVKDENGEDVKQDRFEKVVWCPETEYNEDGSVKDSTGHECTFTVDADNVLVAMEIPEDCGVVEIPANLGAGHGIEIIGSDSFQNNCFLKKIIIPSTVKYIEDYAFKGCHNLEAVIFSQPINITYIGEDAFKTQVNTQHNLECANKDYLSSVETPKLSFTGEISPSSKPFEYAMNWENNINAGNQPLTYITFYSGWPTNLTVRYTPDDVNKPEIGENELINYPKYEELINYVAWDKSGPAEGKITYPYMTAEYAKAAQEAVSAYEGDPNLASSDQTLIVNSALNINLPAGITSIKEGIFSDIEKDADGNILVDDDGNIKTKTEKDPDTGVETRIPQYKYRNEHIKSITMNTVKEIDPYTFAGCERLESVYMAGGSKIGNYAFKDCKALENVEIASSVSELGLRPFAGCSTLKNVNFKESPYYSCENAIIFGLNNGVKDSIVECLELRSSNGVGDYTVGPEELQGITSIAQEAFMDCGHVGKVDLSATTVSTIPEKSFKNTTELNSAILPETVKTIKSEAFRNSGIRLLTIPGNQTNIAEDAFMTGDWVDKPKDREVDPGGTGQPNIQFECIRGTTADDYAKYYWYINPVYDKVFLQHTVTFWDYPNYPDTSEQAVFYKVKVIDGQDAVPPTEPPVHDGVVFNRWTNYQNVSKDIDVYPVFGDDIYTVQFLDDDGTPLTEVQYIEAGKSATPPADPTKEGATFKGWSKPYYNITDNTLCIAQYDYGADTNLHTVTFYSYDGTTIIAEMKVLNGGTVYPPSAPARSGYTFVGWVPAGSFTNITSDKSFTASYDRSSGGSGGNGSNGNGSGNGSSSSASPSPTATPNPEDSVKKYTVSVSGGSGSGSYPAGTVVAINAYDMGEGQNFDKWTSSTAGVGFANPNATSTTFTMPAANVAITATYKTGSGSSSGGSNTGAGSGSGTAAYNNRNNGTIVDVNRPGISNTNLAGATVSGSTDNFIVKVTEDQSATDAVIAALQAAYGDISRFKYLPMDISLYDSTGRIKIADTSGISVNLTLPLPDDLVQYAGNNQVAAVSNGTLEKLNARFTTVDGVPCVNFTATHFSPYVIYVDTANLTEATIDATPKTGDPIHPKWFLALGLACVSLILFFKRDKVVINTKTA